MLETYTDYNGREWVTAETLSYGDYGGAGTLGHANINWIREHAKKENKNVLEIWNSGNLFDSNNKIDDQYIKYRLENSNSGSYVPEDYDNAEILIVNEYYHGCIVFVDSKSSLMENVNALADYPVFDDEYVAKVEYEWRLEAQEDLMDELFVSLQEEYPNFYDWWTSPCPSFVADDPKKPAYTPYECFSSFIEEATWETSNQSDYWEYEYGSAYLRPDRVYNEFKEYFFNRLRKAFCVEGRPIHNRKLARERWLKLV